MILKGKKVLLLSVFFFGYEIEIKEKLEQMGAYVDLYNERSISSAFNRAILKITPWIFDPWTSHYYKKIINDNIDKNYDYVFFNGTEMIDRKILLSMRRAFPNALMITYEADSVLKKEKVQGLFDLFDAVYTYDRRDYDVFIKKYPNVRFRPLYYGDSYKKVEIKQTKKDIDVIFVGTIHSDRNRIISCVEQECKRQGLNFYKYCYLQSRFMYLFHFLTDKSFRSHKRDEYKYEKLSGQQISKLYDRSVAILDMQHPKNMGLTMRTLETIASGKKIITTNADIVNYDFYFPENVCVIDRNNPSIDPKFIKSEYKSIPEEVLERYSLEYWLKEIFQLEEYRRCFDD